MRAHFAFLLTLMSPHVLLAQQQQQSLTLYDGHIVNQQYVDSLERAAAQKSKSHRYKVLMIADYSSSGFGLKSQSVPGYSDEVYNPALSDTLYAYYGYFQQIGLKYTLEDYANRQKAFQDVLTNGWTETLANGSQVQHPSLLQALNLNPSDPSQFGMIVSDFAAILGGIKPYDQVKNQEGTHTSYGVVDALTTNRSGVCVDFALWIGEMMGMAGVKDFDLSSFRKTFSTFSFATEGEAHEMGKIRNPHTGEYYYINYGQVMKLEKGSLVATNELLGTQGFAFPDNGITQKRNIPSFATDGSVTSRADELSGVYLTPLGKGYQDLVYGGSSSFENLQIQAVTGIQPTQKASGGVSFLKEENYEGGRESKQYDIGVSYLNLQSMIGLPNTKRMIVWAKLKEESIQAKGSDWRYQMFLGGGGGSDIGNMGMLDAALEYSPKMTFNLKFLSKDATLKVQGLFGLRSMAYAQTNPSTSDIETKVNRTHMVLEDAQGKKLGTYDPTTQTFTSYTQYNPIYGYDTSQYKIYDQDTQETWFWSDRNQITPYYYVYGGQSTKMLRSWDENVRNYNSLKAEVKVSPRFSFFGEGIYLLAPSIKNNSTYRGSNLYALDNFYLAQEKGFRVGASGNTRVGDKKLIASGTYKKLFNPFGDRQFLQMRVDLLKNEKDFFIYGGSQRFNDYSESGANNFNEAGIGYQGRFLKGTQGSAQFGVVNYPESQQNMIQGSIRMTIGSGKNRTKKKNQ